MSSTLELFSFIRKKSNKLGPSGSDFWQSVKRLLEYYDHVKISWETVFYDQELCESIMNLPDTIPMNYFLKQCIRIPKTSTMTIGQLMQLAYNIGQILYILDNDYTPRNEIITRFIKTRMYMFHTYVQIHTDTSVFDKKITRELIDKIKSL